MANSDTSDQELAELTCGIRMVSIARGTLWSQAIKLLDEHTKAESRNAILTAQQTKMRRLCLRDGKLAAILKALEVFPEDSVFDHVKGLEGYSALLAELTDDALAEFARTMIKKFAVDGGERGKSDGAS
ncbi:hypothetical protein LTR37_019452 [Vermiconidia calcicola]|uniref:Uncharacterized protein n=1 Tax=Vermiconidia calcicola TaxID=1690605 RepID=A0ACC3MH67_9PEZI|nr:hypothetical protein LTR37_019452 [Vermiconidia calcicola]